MTVLTMDLTIEYPTAEDAASVYGSAAPDDDSFVTTRVEGNKVLFTFKAETAGQMRSAMDDVLACVKVAEAALGIVAGTGPDLDGDALLE